MTPKLASIIFVQKLASHRISRAGINCCISFFILDIVHVALQIQSLFLYLTLCGLSDSQAEENEFGQQAPYINYRWLFSINFCTSSIYMYQMRVSVVFYYKFWFLLLWYTFKHMY